MRHRYAAWFEPVLAEVEAFVRGEVAALQAVARAERQAARTTRRAVRRAESRAARSSGGGHRSAEAATAEAGPRHGSPRLEGCGEAAEAESTAHPLHCGDGGGGGGGSDSDKGGSGGGRVNGDPASSEFTDISAASLESGGKERNRVGSSIGKAPEESDDESSQDSNDDDDDDDNDKETAALEAAAEAEAEAEAMLPCELHDMHMLRQVHFVALFRPNSLLSYR